jgi:predicted CopG family antitoxin
MSRTLTISDELYERLLAEVNRRGLSTIEELLQSTGFQDDELARRREAVRRIDEVRERIKAVHGQMEDSVPLIREDRAR